MSSSFQGGGTGIRLGIVGGLYVLIFPFIKCQDCEENIHVRCKENITVDS